MFDLVQTLLLTVCEQNKNMDLYRIQMNRKDWATGDFNLTGNDMFTFFLDRVHRCFATGLKWSEEQVNFNFGGKSREESSRCVLNPQKKRKIKICLVRKPQLSLHQPHHLTTCLAKVSSTMSSLACVLCGRCQHYCRLLSAIPWMHLCS